MPLFPVPSLCHPQLLRFHTSPPIAAVSQAYRHQILLLRLRAAWALVPVLHLLNLQVWEARLKAHFLQVRLMRAAPVRRRDSRRLLRFTKVAPQRQPVVRFKQVQILHPPLPERFPRQRIARQRAARCNIHQRAQQCPQGPRRRPSPASQVSRRPLLQRAAAFTVRSPPERLQLSIARLVSTLHSQWQPAVVCTIVNRQRTVLQF